MGVSSRIKIRILLHRCKSFVESAKSVSLGKKYGFQQAFPRVVVGGLLLFGFIGVSLDKTLGMGRTLAP